MIRTWHPMDSTSSLLLLQCHQISPISCPVTQSCNRFVLFLLIIYFRWDGWFVQDYSPNTKVCTGFCLNTQVWKSILWITLRYAWNSGDSTRWTWRSLRNRAELSEQQDQDDHCLLWFVCMQAWVGGGYGRIADCSFTTFRKSLADIEMSIIVFLSCRSQISIIVTFLVIFPVEYLFVLETFWKIQDFYVLFQFGNFD